MVLLCPYALRCRCAGCKDIHALLRRYLLAPGRGREPMVVYYDFACALEKYCLARDPWLFRNVVFMIDKFHLKNHTCNFQSKCNDHRTNA